MRRSGLRWLPALFLSLQTACGGSRAVTHPPPRAQQEQTRQPKPVDSVPTADAHAVSLIAAEPELMQLAVEGHHPAWISLLPEAERQPVLFAMHGAGGYAEWHCSHWRELLGKRGLIVCPAGDPIGPGLDYGFYFRDHFALRKEVLAVLHAVATQLTSQADLERSVFLGYSQGATMGVHALFVDDSAAKDVSMRIFSKLVLVEGGFSEWSVGRGLSFAKQGGQRVLFACGTRGCDRAAQRSREWLARASVDAQAVLAEHAGHTPAGRVGDAVRAHWDWLVADDVRWHVREQ